MPLSALFILFDFVVHNPTHRETRSNLALLDVAAGYFSRLEYATGGSVPSSLLSDFAHIARQFIREVQSRGLPADVRSRPSTNSDHLDHPPVVHQNVEVPSTPSAVSLVKHGQLGPAWAGKLPSGNQTMSSNSPIAGLRHPKPRCNERGKFNH